MIGRLPKPKRNPNAGRKPRANPLLRLYRQARRKRVAYARAQACDTLAHAQKQIARYEALAKAWNVPVDAMEPLPPVPNLPGDEWVEFLRDMGELKAPVVVAQPKPQQEQAMA